MERQSRATHPASSCRVATESTRTGPKGEGGGGGGGSGGFVGLLQRKDVIPAATRCSCQDILLPGWGHCQSRASHRGCRIQSRISCLCQLIILREIEVGVLCMRPELGCCCHIEYQSGPNICGIAQPYQMVRHGALQQIHHDAGEIDVYDDHHVKMLEELQLCEISCSLAVCLGSLP